MPSLPAQDPVPLMLVEDDDLLREEMRDVLERAGYVVYSAIDGEDALRQLRSGMVRPRVMVVDLGMPRMDGAQLIDSVRHERDLADLPILVVTGDERGLERVRSRTALGVLGKPMSGPQLVGAVRELQLRGPAGS